MVLGKLSVPVRPTNLDNSVEQGPIVLAVGAGGDCLDIFFSSIFSLLPVWETDRYRLIYCLKGPLNPKQPTNQLPLNEGNNFYDSLFAPLNTEAFPK